jgi:hypothetical protein
MELVIHGKLYNYKYLLKSQIMDLELLQINSYSRQFRQLQHCITILFRNICIKIIKAVPLNTTEALGWREGVVVPTRSQPRH